MKKKRKLKSPLWKKKGRNINTYTYNEDQLTDSSCHHLQAVGVL